MGTQNLYIAKRSSTFIYACCQSGMINFEKELKNFQPSLEVEEAEAAIYNHDLTDVTDIITEILRDVRQNGQQLGQ